ncbi:MAG: flagellar assembly protein FliW [Bacillota bacterium]
MKINTQRFGEIEVQDDRVIRFENGIPGFESLHSFIILNVEQTAPVSWMQSVEEPGIALTVVDPFELVTAYSLEINDAEVEDLCLNDQADLMVLGVMVIPKDITKMTVNLAAPILINTKKGIGKQIVMDNRQFSTRHPVYQGFLEAVKGGKAYAGADAKG